MIRPEDILFRTKDLSPDIVLVIYMSFKLDLAGRALGSSGDLLTSVAGRGYISPEELNQKWARQGHFLPLPIIHTTMEC